MHLHQQGVEDVVQEGARTAASSEASILEEGLELELASPAAILQGDSAEDSQVAPRLAVRMTVAGSVEV